MLTALALTGCTHGGDAQAREVAAEIAGYDGVLDAEGDAVTEYDSVLSLTIDLDPELGDDELVALVHRIEERSQRSGWSQQWNLYRLGDDRAYANTMGENALAVLVGIRADPAYTEAYAGGGGEGVRGSFFVAGPPVDELLGHYHHLVELAEDAGGVQTNLQFTAATAEGDVTVSGTYLVAPEGAVAELQALMQEFAIDRAWALALETDAQLLNVWVADADVQAAVETRAAEQQLVDVRVYVTE